MVSIPIFQMILIYFLLKTLTIENRNTIGNGSLLVIFGRMLTFL